MEINGSKFSLTKKTNSFVTKKQNTRSFSTPNLQSNFRPMGGKSSAFNAIKDNADISNNAYKKSFSIKQQQKSASLLKTFNKGHSKASSLNTKSTDQLKKISDKIYKMSQALEGKDISAAKRKSVNKKLDTTLERLETALKDYTLSDKAEKVYDEVKSRATSIRSELDHAFTRSKSFASTNISINNGKEESEFNIDISSAIENRFQVDLNVASDSKAKKANINITSSSISGEIKIREVKDKHVTFNIDSDISGSVSTDVGNNKVKFNIDNYDEANIIIDIDAQSKKNIVVNISLASDQTEYAEYEAANISTRNLNNLTRNFEDSLEETDLQLGTRAESSASDPLYSFLKKTLDSGLKSSYEQLNSAKSSITQLSKFKL